MEQFIFPAFIVVFIASLIAAYNMGWHSGHDVHHPPGTPRPPQKDKNLYV